MEKYYYITNGNNDTEKYRLLTSKEDSSKTNAIVVTDEFGNGVGWEFEISSLVLNNIAKEDYEELAGLIGDWSQENEEKFYKKANLLIHGKYHEFSGDPWKDENGWWNDLTIPECLESVDALIDSLQKWKDDAQQYYKKKDNNHAKKVAAGFESNMAYSCGPGINDLIITFVRLGYMNISQLPEVFQDYYKRMM